MVNCREPSAKSECSHTRLVDDDTFYERYPEDTTELQNCLRSAQGAMLLLLWEQHLKEMYRITVWCVGKRCHRGSVETVFEFPFSDVSL